jgi:hypothetical protein
MRIGRVGVLISWLLVLLVFGPSAHAQPGALDPNFGNGGIVPRRVLAAGATKFDFQPNDHCRVYADPVGRPSASLPKTFRRAKLSGFGSYGLL